MFYQLPPAGNSVRISTTDSWKSFVEKWFSPFEHRFYSSGTMALAAGLIAVKSASGKKNPEVILPAYCCPDLVSAIIYAGAIPVFVDLEKDRTWLALSQLKEKLTKRTIAIVAVDLFGIPERSQELRKLIVDTEIVLIQDSAQYFPDTIDSKTLYGDLAVLSFGRGKPVSLLAGGVLVVKNRGLMEWLSNSVMNQPRVILEKLKIWFRLHAYNLLISPYLYWLPNSLPFLHLGETRFKPLRKITYLSDANLRLLPANVEAYLCKENNAQKQIGTMLRELGLKNIVDLPIVSWGDRITRLNRYPILISDELLRDRLFYLLSEKGLGVSKMYPAPLPNIPGVDTVLMSNELFKNSQSFSQRILTLPTHERVSARDIISMKTVFEKVVNSS